MNKAVILLEKPASEGINLMALRITDSWDLIHWMRSPNLSVVRGTRERRNIEIEIKVRMNWKWRLTFVLFTIHYMKWKSLWFRTACRRGKLNGNWFFILLCAFTISVFLLLTENSWFREKEKPYQMDTKNFYLELWISLTKLATLCTEIPITSHVKLKW